MSQILEQLELNQSFFIQFFIFATVFVVLSQVYFKPFMKLFHLRHERTIADTEAAAKLMNQAQLKLEEYKEIISKEQKSARSDFEVALNEAKKKETEILSQAREEAKKITQNAIEIISKEKLQIQKQLEQEVDALAQKMTDKLLSKMS